MSSDGIHAAVGRRSASGINRMLNQSKVVNEGDFHDYTTGSHALAGTKPSFE
jgi:hypothetical protein